MEKAASLEVDGNTVKVINLTGHKIISGYPEGRRMWLNIKWEDASGMVIREDGEYGPIDVTLDGQHFAVAASNPDAPAREIHVVLNWFEELRARN